MKKKRDQREYLKKYYLKNKESAILRVQKWRENNLEKRNEYEKKYRENNREKIAEYKKKSAAKVPAQERKNRSRKIYEKHKDRMLLYSKRKRILLKQQNPELLKQKEHQKYLRNKDRALAYQKVYYSRPEKKKMMSDRAKNRRKSDILYRIRTNLRNSSCKAFARIRSNKPFTTHALLGADYITIKEYIESQFTDGMNWENYGKWEIDHIVPLFSAKTQDELIPLCYYTNLQPLWERDNIIKGHKVIERT